MKTIIIEEIEIKLSRKKIKNINLSVHPPDGEVRISAPLKTKDETINKFVHSKLEWIKTHQERFSKQEVAPINQYVSGEEHYFMGKKYSLNIIEIEKNPSKVQIREGLYIDLYIKKETSKDQRARIIKEWQRKELKLLIPPLIEKWEKIMGVKVAEFGVKEMKTRWGTCNVVARRVWINLQLAKKPPHCLEYIVVHEMVHLLERSHNHRFKAYMDQFLPQWPSIKKELNTN